MGPTPMLYYAEASAEDVQGGIQITGSHNPANYNGFKMVFMGRPFFGGDIQELGRLAAAGDWMVGQGAFEHREILGTYVDRLVEGLAGIGLDQLSDRCGSAGTRATGPPAPRSNCWSRSCLASTILLFTQVDGTFSRTIIRIPLRRRIWPI
jgi:phosphomannomutase